VGHRYRQRIVVRSHGQTPQQFIWQGRRYRVRKVLQFWVEASPWWRNLHGGGERALEQRDVWRVEATTDTGQTGVYDLCATPTTWMLLRVID
jgi:Family of unknown function (DUF6504)